MPGNPKDLRVGMRALARGFIQAGALQEAIVEHSRRLDQTGAIGPSFDFFLLSRGYLTAEQLAAVVIDEAAPAPPVPAAPPSLKSRNSRVFGKFSVLRELGRGSMGEVVEAIDLTNGRRVALKRPYFRTLRPLTPDDEERFLREAQVVSGIPRHRHLVEIFEHGRIDHQCYLAMEVVDGRSMSEWRKTATLRQELDVLLQIAAGLDHIHRHGVLHRDLKPANVMIRERGEAVLMDFGLAKALGPRRDISLTPIGSMIGSPGYMSPEQARGLKTIDHRTDVYSLGVILYQAMTGHRPFEGRSPVETLMKMLEDPVRRPTEIMKGGLNPALYLDLEAVCLHALQKNPVDRTPSAEAFMAELRGVLRTSRPLGVAG